MHSRREDGKHLVYIPVIEAVPIDKLSGGKLYHLVFLLFS